MNGRFADTYVSRQGLYSLGRDDDAHCYFLSIPVANQMVDYEEYYRLTDMQYEEFVRDNKKAKAFADACRQRRNDAFLILAPGSDRGVAI